MSTGTSKGLCIICGQEKRTVTCDGCRQLFCFNHLTNHQQELSGQLDEIEMNRDIFRQTLNEQTNNPKRHALIKQIDQWEENSIKTIQRTARKCRELLIQHTTDHINQLEVNLAELTNQIRQIRKENDFNEIDLNQFKQKLTQLSKELDKPTNVSIQEGSASLINKISVVVSSQQLSSFSSHINLNTKWKQSGMTIAGGNGRGNRLNQLWSPHRIYIDDNDQCIYITDCGNHRIVRWQYDAKNGEVVAGGNGEGNRIDQLNGPSDVIVDKNNNSLIICDYDNRRVVQWSLQADRNPQIIISNIGCHSIAMDNNGDLYVSDKEKNEVRRWKIGDKNGTIVAGGNGKGNNLNQLKFPTYILVDKDYSVYVSDPQNHRVMKWKKGGKEGIVVAGGRGEGNSMSQLSFPGGIIVDHLGNVYVADDKNHRIMRWSLGSKEGNIVVGGNGKGNEPNQFNNPVGLSFDREGHLYVADWGNDRAQKFVIN